MPAIPWHIMMGQPKKYWRPVMVGGDRNMCVEGAVLSLGLFGTPFKNHLVIQKQITHSAK